MYYDEEPVPDFVQQGDIFRDFIITTIPKDFLVARGGFLDENLEEGEATLKPSQSIPDLFSSGIELIVTRATKSNVIVISQTCDIQNREFVIIAPVFPLSRIESDKRVRAVKEGKTFYRFFLPQKEGIIEEAFVELTILNSVRRDCLSLERRILSLTHFYRGHFVYHLNRFLCRPFMPEETNGT